MCVEWNIEIVLDLLNNTPAWARILPLQVQGPQTMQHGADLHVVLEIVHQEAHVTPQLPHLGQFPGTLLVLHEECPALMEGHLGATNGEQKLEQ